MYCGHPWQPTKLKQFVESLPNSTRPLHVMTDKGAAILKALGNPAGPEALAFELVGTELARWMGLTTPDFATLHLTDMPANWSPHFTIENGNAFLSRYIASSTHDGQATFLDRLARPDDLARLVVFDTWIRNADRYPPEEALMERPPNLDNLMFARHPGTRRLKYNLIVFDHTHAFSDAGYDGLDDEAMIAMS